MKFNSNDSIGLKYNFDKKEIEVYKTNDFL